MPSTLSRNATLREARDRVVPRGLASAHPIFAAQAAGARLWDVDGREYVDFAGGIGVLNVGHGHPKVVGAVRAQLERYAHVCAQVTLYEPYVRLAERLAALAPGEHASKALLLTTGAEAVENAVKIARAATGRPAVVAFAHSFHGRTLLGLSLTGKSAPYKQGFGPYAPEVYHAPYPDPYRGRSGASALEAFEELLATQVEAKQVAAVVIEPVLGEGGFIPAPPEFLVALRELTRRHGMLLVADEIQSGFGRTGRFFAIEHSGVVPDLITTAKSLGGGLPISGVIGRAEVMDAPGPGGLGGTFGGNPLACAAALAVLEVFKEEALLERSARLGDRLAAGLRAIRDRHAPHGDVRGLGPMMALELVGDARRTPDAAWASRAVGRARELGLILLTAGLDANVLRILVPLNVGDRELEAGLERLELAVAETRPGTAP